MSIEIVVGCGQCGKEKTIWVHNPQKDDRLGVLLVGGLPKPWVMQDNGQLDTYCCAKCAA